MSIQNADALSISGSEVSKTEGSLPLDEVFSILSNPRRLHAIAVLLSDGRMDKGQLADRVAELEFERPIDQIDKAKERHKVYVSLQQTHLPTLEESGVVVREGNEIVLGPNAESCKQALLGPQSTSLAARLRSSIASIC